MSENNIEALEFYKLLEILDEVYGKYITDFSEENIIIGAEYNENVYLFTKLAFVTHDKENLNPQIKLISDMQQVANNIGDDYVDIVTLQDIYNLCDNIINSEKSVFKPEYNLSYGQKEVIIFNIPVSIRLIDLDGNIFDTDLHNPLIIGTGIISVSDETAIFCISINE